MVHYLNIMLPKPALVIDSGDKKKTKNKKKKNDEGYLLNLH